MSAPSSSRRMRMVSSVLGPAGAGGGLASMKLQALLRPPPAMCAVRLIEVACAAEHDVEKRQQQRHKGAFKTGDQEVPHTDTMMAERMSRRLHPLTC